MSFRIKLGVLLSSVLLLNLALALASWWSIEKGFERHDRSTSFTKAGSTLFQAMHQEELRLTHDYRTISAQPLVRAAEEFQRIFAENQNALDKSLQPQVQLLLDDLLQYRSRLNQMTVLQEKIRAAFPHPDTEPERTLEGLIEKSRTLRQNIEKKLEIIIRQQEALGSEQLERLRMWVITVSLLGVIISLVLAFIFSARFTGLLTQLKKSAEDIADGKLTTTVEVNRRDDIGQLADIFNRMTQKLRHNFNELVEYRDNLEELVSSRTKELEKEIADRLKTENALRSSEEYLRTIIDQSPIGMIVWDTSFRISQWNKRAEEIFGYSAEDAAGLPASRLLPETMHPHITKIWQKLVTTESGVRSRNENITKDRRTILCDWFNTPISNSQGQVLGALSLIENVTERLQEEKELIKIEKLESTGILAGGIAHDFNNILTAILGNINIALRDRNLSDTTRELLSSAEQASIRARVVTRQLLTFAKGGEPILEPAQLGEIVRESTDFVLNGSNVTALYTIPDDLWQVPVDRGQISQVIENIVLNSRQAMKHSGVLEIACENVHRDDSSYAFLDRTKPFIRIIIRDSGPGIPTKLLDKIFDPYFSTRDEGSGLGLAVSLSIVNKHNGRIMVNSESGKGAEFILYLPAIGTETTHKESEGKVSLQPQSIRVLIMDDDESVRRVLHVMLELLGHQVFQASNGEEAIAIYRDRLHSDEPIDLVIADLSIPGGMGGKEAMSALLEIDPGTRAIVSSGYSSDPVMASCRDYGFRVAINKPYVLEKLEKAIHAALAGKDNGT
jgi:PAS domain S-box-containing protein